MYIEGPPPLYISYVSREQTKQDHNQKAIIYSDLQVCWIIMVIYFRCKMQVASRTGVNTFKSARWSRPNNH